MRVQLHDLELTYPPISNQEAEWLKDVPEVQEQLKQSKLYFIAQKPESKFEFKEDVTSKISNNKIIEFDLRTGNKFISGIIDIDALINYNEINTETFDDIEIELGEKLIRLWLISKNEQPKILDWFTTEKILFDYSRNKECYIKGMCNYREFTQYNLHYIGISKKNDSFTRLVIKPHDKRLRIISNEHPLSSGSRLTDEIILFFFNIDSLEIKQYLQDSDFDNIGKNELEDKTRIVIDAEKAFVKVLNANYNQVKFNQYPISEDGLFDSSVERYSFSINEDIEFITDDNSIFGERKNRIGQSNSDFISIDKENLEVNLIKLVI